MSDFWNDATITRLTELWAEGISTAEIGHRMGVSKNAVVGKAHRLNLPSRPSPIKRDRVATPRRSRPKRALKITLAGIASAEIAMARNTNAMLPTAVMRGKVGECQYPNGAVFCCEPTEPGKPYCNKHANVCYARSASQRAAALSAIKARAERAADAE